EASMRAFATLDDADIKNKRVLVRVDLNVRVVGGKVTDRTRIERIAPTIIELVDKGAKVILLSHFGRPSGHDPKQSLKLLAPAIADVLKRPVTFAEDCIGKEATAAVAAMNPGDIVCLENTRLRKRTILISLRSSRRSATFSSMMPFRWRIARNTSV